MEFILLDPLNMERRSQVLIPWSWSLLLLVISVHPRREFRKAQAYDPGYIFQGQRGAEGWLSISNI